MMDIYQQINHIRRMIEQHPTEGSAENQLLRTLDRYSQDYLESLTTLQTVMNNDHSLENHVTCVVCSAWDNYYDMQHDLHNIIADCLFNRSIDDLHPYLNDLSITLEDITHTLEERQIEIYLRDELILPNMAVLEQVPEQVSDSDYSSDD